MIKKILSLFIIMFLSISLIYATGECSSRSFFFQESQIGTFNTNEPNFEQGDLIFTNFVPSSPLSFEILINNFDYDSLKIGMWQKNNPEIEVFCEYGYNMGSPFLRYQNGDYGPPLTNSYNEVDFIINTTTSWPFTGTDILLEFNLNIENLKLDTPYIIRAVNRENFFYNDMEIEFRTLQTNNGLSSVTSTLPTIGNDIGGFLTNISNPFALWLLLFVIVSGVAGFFTSIIFLTKNNLKKK